MPFREKAKNLFKTKSRADSLSKADTNGSDRDRYPSNVYKPGEPMPRPKYRRPPEKEHKEKLEAFSFSDAWRKRSFQSSHSPGGTRVPSRRTSAFSLGRKSLGGRSVGRKSVSGRSEGGRTGSDTSEYADKSGVRHREGMGATMSTQAEQEGDDDVTNVGISRVQSRDRPAHPRAAEDVHMNGVPNGLHKTKSTAHDHQPFTEQDITAALSRSHLQVPAQS